MVTKVRITREQAAADLAARKESALAHVEFRHAQSRAFASASDELLRHIRADDEKARTSRWERAFDIGLIHLLSADGSGHEEFMSNYATHVVMARRAADAIHGRIHPLGPRQRNESVPTDGAWE